MITLSTSLYASLAAQKTDDSPSRKVAVLLTISGYPQDSGLMYGAVYTSPKSFLDPSAAILRFIVPSKSPTRRIVLPEVPEGEIAITLYQDTNNNKQLDTNFLGIPKEPVALTQTHPSWFGPPTFHQSAIKVSKDNRQITMQFK